MSFATEVDVVTTAPTSDTDRRWNPIVRLLLADRTARWTSRIALVAVWQFAAGISDHVATPVQTLQFIVDEFHRTYRGEPWTIWDN